MGVIRDVNEINLILARFVTDEPEVLESDLKKAGTLESMHYHDDWSMIMDVYKKIKIIPEDEIDNLRLEPLKYMVEDALKDASIEELASTCAVFVDAYRENKAALIHREVESAKDTLTKYGYAVSNLWSIHDVVGKYDCDNDTASEILDSVLASERICGEINEDIQSEAEDNYKLTPKEDE